MLTVDDVARLLNIDTNKVRELVDSKQLAASDQDGRLQFTQADVNVYILGALAAIDDDDESDWNDDAD